jgi:hypothetical protein
MTSLAVKPTDLGDGIVSRKNGLEITVELTFNDWKRLGEKLLETQDRALWSIGDWRVYGERYGKEYHEALASLDEASRFIQASARVARSFETERRRDQLTFEMHEVVAGCEPDEQDQWLDDAERQGWTRRQMQFAFVEAIAKVPLPSLSVKAVGELRELCVQAAERQGMDPREWAMQVLERAARETLALEAA